MIPFILPNLYHRIKDLPKKDLAVDSNYYDWMEDIWKYVEPSYDAFSAWAKQRCFGEITDLGCGNGYIGKKLGAKYFYDYIKSFNEVEVFDLMNLYDLHLKGNTFILSHVLEHLQYPKEVLLDLFENLKSGDRIILCVPDGGHLESTALPFQMYIPSNDCKSKHKHHYYSWTGSDLYNTLIRTGFDEVEMSFANISGFATLWAVGVKP